MRSLWVVRISAAAKSLGTSYSRLIDALNKARMAVDRKMLAEMAVSDPAGFAQLVRTAQGAAAARSAPRPSGGPAADGFRGRSGFQPGAPFLWIVL
jgi:hypothetical protein